MEESSASLGKRPQRSQRIDYHLLNDGSDEEVALEDRITKKTRLIQPDNSIDLITPDDSASQLIQVQSPPADISQQEASNNIELETSSISCDPEHPQKTLQNQSLWAEFDIVPLPGSHWWPKRGRGPLEDREIRCTRCGWKTADSARATSTSNMRSHLKKHGIFSSGSANSQENNKSCIKQSSIVSSFQRQAENQATKHLEQNLVRWIVTENMAFNAIESSTFQNIFRDLGIGLPFTSRMTVTRRIDPEFDSYRARLIDDLDQTSQTIALSLDAWTSKNCKAIFAVIGHWLTADFQYQERVLDFTEITGIHSGENMAEILQTTLEELNIEHKVLTITADNAANNETLMSELYFNLKEKFDNMASPANGERKLPRFQGMDSYMRCIAHVLNPICGSWCGRERSPDNILTIKTIKSYRCPKGLL